MADVTELTINEQQQMQLLKNGLITADKFINKNYLIDISNQNVIALTEDSKVLNSVRLFKIEKLVYDKSENVNDKLISVYSAL